MPASEASLLRAPEQGQRGDRRDANRVSKRKKSGRGNRRKKNKKGGWSHSGANYRTRVRLQAALLLCLLGVPGEVKTQG